MARIPLPTDYINKSDPMFNAATARPINNTNLNNTNRRINELDENIVNIEGDIDVVKTDIDNVEQDIVTINNTIAGISVPGGRADTADRWTTPRTLTATGNATGSVLMDGSTNISLPLTVSYATAAGTANNAGYLAANRTLTLSGGVTGSVSTNWASNPTIATTLNGCIKYIQNGTYSSSFITVPAGTSDITLNIPITAINTSKAIAIVYPLSGLSYVIPGFTYINISYPITRSTSFTTSTNLQVSVGIPWTGSTSSIQTGMTIRWTVVEFY